MNQQTYIPGVCNIGPAEIAARKQMGWISGILAIIFGAVFFGLKVNPSLRLLLFFPVTATAMGLLQGYSHFCAGFGMKGFFNFGKELGKTESVQQQEFRKKDKEKAWQIIDASIVVGIIVAIMALYI